MTFAPDQPGWLQCAWAELGVQEQQGAGTNPRIRDFFADAGHPEIASDEVAWCAAFVSASLERSHTASQRTLLARDYLSWGEELSAPRLGAIAVLSRDPDPASGHVGFLVGETAQSLILLGGNQHNGVTVQAFPKPRLLSLRWPALTQPLIREPHPAAPYHSPQFDHALAHVLEMEGGYSDDPADPGGPTNFGITLADYARFKNTKLDAASRDALIDGLRHIPPTDVRAIYAASYWIASGSANLPPPLAFFHFDTAVNMGTGTAIRMLQTALGCPIDGEFGAQTQAAAVEADPAGLLELLAGLRRRRYRALPAFKTFGRGWLSRVDTTLARALSLIQQQGTVPMSTDPTFEPAPSAAPAIEPKWWGQSITIWGAVASGLAAVLPAIGPAFGVDVSAATIHTAADQIGATVQAAAGLVGTLLAIYGRLRATQPLKQRLITVKV